MIDFAKGLAKLQTRRDLEVQIIVTCESPGRAHREQSSVQSASSKPGRRPAFSAMSSNRPPLEQLAGTSYKRLVDFVSSRSHSQHFERRRKGVRVDAYISSVSKSQSLWPILGRAKRLVYSSFKEKQN